MSQTIEQLTGSRYPLFQRDALTLQSLVKREHALFLQNILPLSPTSGIPNSDLIRTATEIVRARNRDKSVILIMGAHVLRDGVQRYIIDLMNRGMISCIAVNGAGIIHDFEFSMVGATTESVAQYIQTGEFGLWEETGIINDIVVEAALQKKGLGESVGQYIAENKLPHCNISILAHGWKLGIPITAHVGIGYDIVHEHPNCDGGSWGQASYTDFLIFTKILEKIEGGVVMNFGSAVMGPEIFLKALAMVRNTNHPSNNFTSLVCDLKPLPDAYHEEANKNNPFYYFRPWKTLLVRTVAGTGKSYYVRGQHKNTIPGLWTALTPNSDIE